MGLERLTKLFLLLVPKFSKKNCDQNQFVLETPIQTIKNHYPAGRSIDWD
jgi:hypothetical protein